MNINQRKSADGIANGVMHPMSATDEPAPAEFAVNVLNAHSGNAEGIGFESFLAHCDVGYNAGFVSVLEMSLDEFPAERSFSPRIPVGFGYSLSSENIFLCNDFGEPHESVIGGDFGIADVQNVQPHAPLDALEGGLVEVSRCVPGGMEASHDYARDFHGEEFCYGLSQPELVMPGVAVCSLESAPFHVEFIAEVEASELLLLECGHSGNPEDASVTEIQV